VQVRNHDFLVACDAPILFTCCFQPLSHPGLFGIYLIVTRGVTIGFEFFAGYLVEQSLSIDNLFVFIMLFDYFRVPMELQTRVLNWGIVGAIALRGLMIVVGVAAIQKFKSVILVFAWILVASSIKLLTEKNNSASEHMNDNVILKITRWIFLGTSNEFDGQNFFTIRNGRKTAKPLLFVLSYPTLFSLWIRSLLSLVSQKTHW
jgi:TerC family integral membrane protein